MIPTPSIERTASLGDYWCVSDVYDQFYKLTGMPFRLTPDPKFFFHSRGHSKSLAYLRYGLQQGEGFVVITGEVGAGKTTLVRALESQLRMSNVVAAELVTTNLDPDQLVRMVAGAFGLANDGVPKATLLKNLQGFMAARVKEGKRVLLVIDEAHNLPASALEELRMLSNYQSGERALLQTFLLGQGEFRNTLQARSLEQFRQRVIAAHHLGPMDKDESRQYINHRLRVVEWRDDPRFTDQAYDLIHSHTGGIPRQINLLCDRVLLKAALDESHEINDQTVQEVIDEQQEEIPKLSEDELAERREEEMEAARLVASAPEGFGPEGQPMVVNATSMDVERRIQYLERKVEELERRIRKDQARLQKLVMMAMLSDDEVNLAEVFQDLKKSG